MAQLMSRIRRALRDEQRHDHVHFHAGPAGRPAPCFAERCSSPRLDPWEGSPLLFP